MKKFLAVLLATFFSHCALAAYVGSASNTTGAVDATTVVVTATPPNGSRILAAVMRGDVGVTSGNTPTGVPSGFSLIGSAKTSAQNVGKQGVLYIYEKLVASSEAGTYTFTYGSSVAFSVSVVWFSGRHASTAATVTTSDDTGNGTTPVSAAIPGVTAALNDDIAAFHPIAWASYVGVSTGTAPASYTERIETDSGAGAFGNYLSTRDAVSSGATGTLTATLSNGVLAGEFFGIVVALPVAGGGGGTVINPISGGGGAAARPVTFN